MPYQIRALWALCVLLLTACASTPPPAFTPPVYPPPPDEPRFVYERTLRTNEDVEQLTGFARWRELATGNTDKVRGLVKPYGVAARQGRIYISDTAQSALLQFDIAGGRFLQFGEKDPGKLQKPIGLCLSPQGDELYVADVSGRRIRVFGADGSFHRNLGSDADLQRPAGVAISPDGKRLYVVDVGGVESDQHRVQVLDPQSGALIQTIGHRGTGDGEFNLPVQAATGPDGRFRFAFGEGGRFPGQFARPKGSATDPSGNVYVADAAFGNVQIFNPQGQVLMFIGSRDVSSRPGKFYLPAGVAVDETGHVYLADQYFRKLDIFKPMGHSGANPVAGAPAHQVETAPPPP